jgi:hypothetical protein
MRSLTARTSLLLLLGALLSLAYVEPAAAGYVYIRSNVGLPWGDSAPTDAMNVVFGSGNWIDERYETAVVGSVFSADNSFVYMDGSDDNATELAAFLTANIAAIESWVAAGGRILINAGPNEGGDFDFGFGISVTYQAGVTNSATADANETSHAVFAGPATPVGTIFTGPISHAMVAGGWLDAILNSSAGPASLAERSYGEGHVVAGGLTVPSFWSPAPNATNLYQNIISYAARDGGMLLATDGASADNNARARALVGKTATATLATIAATPTATLAGYDAIWVNPDLSSASYTTLRTAVAVSGSLYEYANGGGTLVLNVAGNQSSQSDIAPGGIDYDGSTTNNAEIFTTPTASYLTGSGFAGALLQTSDFDSWNQTDRGYLFNLVGGTTVLSNSNGPSFSEYGWGSGKVILTTLSYGWGLNGAIGQPRDNLITYAAGVGGALAGNPSIGQLTVELFTLRIPPPTGDTLPPGSSIVYWPGVFDTGSTQVGLEPDAVTTLDFNHPAVPALLDVRSWGLSVMGQPGLGAPLDFPQSEIEDIAVIELPAGIPSLIGGPVTNGVLADIDYGETVTRPFYLGGTLSFPHMRFYEPGDPGIRTPMYWVDLVPIGTITPGSIGQRYNLGGMRFINGVATASSPSWDFLYDTGNTTTQITTAMATALGINLGAPDTTVCLGSTHPACMGGTTLDGFAIDKVEIDSTDGFFRYTIDNPIVFVQPVGLGGADANIGANFFDGKRVLFDGPGSRLGLNDAVPVPEPSLTLMLVVGAGFLTLIGRRRMNR